MKSITKKIVLPDWANWLAQDCNGDWWAFEFVPISDKFGGWNSPDGEDQRICTGVIRKPWNKTLQRI